ncbi:MAG: AAA family ATPase [Myxococcales bacterium]|nr:AAA family ATPase [Myxococcales bacterium]
MLADPGGALLDAALGKPLPLALTLAVARDLADGLAAIHAAGLVHRDLRPANVLLTRKATAAAIVDLSQATAPVSPGDRSPGLPSDLRYTSPEQTGWQGHAIDPRADLYALGVILFQMIAGRLPFEADDRLALVHAHRARPAPRLSSLVPRVPPVVCDLVNKLLAKRPEARYQTARGLWRDLVRCLETLERDGEIEPFVLAERDLSDRIDVSPRLYGREHELQVLLRAHARVAETGHSEVVLIGGYSGVGKSALVRAFEERLAGSSLFLAGKFDPAHCELPYATFGQALRRYVRSLLSREETEIAAARRLIQGVLGINGQVLVEVVPEIQLLIGAQPSIPELRPTEAQNRLHAVFRRVIDALARPHEPLVLFLDDLQWLDPGSRRLFHHLATSGTRDLLIIGAYRDNEVSPDHPLALAIDELRSSGATVSTLSLGPIEPRALARFVGDCLHCSAEEAAPLATLLGEKTGGNPFFAIQFLLSAHEEGFLTLDVEAGRFRWDLEEIRARQFTDNVVDLMLEKLRRLPEATRIAVFRLACLGSGTRRRLLEIVLEDLEDGLLALEPASRAGLVSEVEGRFMFLHDRVQEAAHALVPAGDHPAHHLDIGRRLSAALHDSELAENIFDVVNRWNAGASLLVRDTDRDELRRLNRLAGNRARNAAAYESARRYFAEALALLPADTWEQDYEDTLDLYLEVAEGKALAGAHERANELLDQASSRARDVIDLARVERLRMRLHQLAGRPREAVEVMLEVLSELGERYPESEEEVEQAFAAEVERIKSLLDAQPIADIVDAPVVTDPRIAACIGLLEEGCPPAYTAKPSLWPLLSARSTTLSLEHGNCEGSAFGFIGGALVLGAILGDWATAYELSAMALRLNERFPSCRVQQHGKLLFHHGAMVEIWRRPFEVGVRRLQEALPACVDVGDLVPAGYLTYNLVWLHFERGTSPSEVAAVARDHMEFARQSHNDLVYQVLRLEAQFAAALAGEEIPRGGDGSSRDAIVGELGAAGFDVGVAFAHVMDQIAAYLDERYDDAFASGEKAAGVLRAVTALAPQATHYFYQALAAAALCASGARDTERLLAVVRDALERHVHWSASCPENFSDRHALIAAELARLEARHDEAAHLYEQAIRLAHDQRHCHNEAIAWRAAARFYEARHFDVIAKTYLDRARACFERWGAPTVATPLAPSSRTESSSATRNAPSLDLLAAVKASHALSEEIVLGALIERLMTVVLEVAGAQRAALLEPLGGTNLALTAVAEVDEGGVRVEERSGPPSSSDLPLSLVNLARRSREPVLLPEPTAWVSVTDPYLQRVSPRSVLCLPILRHAELAGVLYLEHAAVERVFTPDRVELLQLIGTQAAISLENARLYTDLWRENQQRQDAEAATRRVGEQLRQAQRMEAIGHLAGGVAHDFNNLLTIILSSGELLLEELPQHDPRREYAEETREAGRRAASLTRQLLAFSRKQVLKPRVVDLTEVVQHMEKMLRRLIGEDVTLTVRSSSVDPVLVDPGQFEQIVLNLAVNARDAMPRGGTLTIETANILVDERHVANHIGATPGPHVALTVSDTGCGMDAETLARVFEPFFTTKERGKGTGLGLATVFGIVQQSGGHIIVESQPGAGTRFRVLFPRTTARPTDAPEVGAARAGRGGETILVVEDEERVLALIHTMLRGAGYRVLAAETVEDALRLSDQDEPIDLLLTDVVMPRMSGPELAERVRARRPDLRVLYMSGYTDHPITRKTVLDARTHFLSKPLTPSGLRQEIRRLLDPEPAS